MTSLTISIDRTALALGPLVMTGHGDTPGLAVSGYTEPAMQARVSYAPDSAYVHGSVALSAAWQQTMMSFTVFPDGAAGEAQARGWLAELRNALLQMRYLTTVTVGDAAAETWVCDPGSLTPGGGRTRADLVDSNPEYAVVIPCHPIRTVV